MKVADLQIFQADPHLIIATTSVYFPEGQVDERSCWTTFHFWTPSGSFFRPSWQLFTYLFIYLFIYLQEVIKISSAEDEERSFSPELHWRFFLAPSQ